MEPVRRARRLVRVIEDTSSRVRGLSLLDAGRAGDQVRNAGLDELMQFDWTMAGEADHGPGYIEVSLAGRRGRLS